jgi:putative membrane protein
MQTAVSCRRQQTILALAAAILLCILCFSGLHPHDRATWLMETMPVWIALPLLVYTYRRFSLTNLLYGLIFLHALILIVGGVYTYAHVPLGFWVQDIFSLSRNPYDKLGHFAQGLVPALLTKEILLRGHYVSGRKMAAFLSVCVALAISAFYELIEWWAALIMGQGADEFLGTQGDVWDTQSDMLMALIGALFAVLLLARWHDRQLKKLADMAASNAAA